MIREFLVEEQDNTLENENVNDYSFTLKYINLNSEIIYYIQCNESEYILEETNKSLNKSFNFVTLKVKYSLITGKKVNTARVIYDSTQDEYFIATYLHSTNMLEEFISARLKKFRGLNKNNTTLHIKESILRYNNNKTTLLDSLSKISI